MPGWDDCIYGLVVINDCSRNEGELMNEQSISDWKVEIQRYRRIILNRMLLIIVFGGLIAMVSLATELQVSPNTLEWWTTMAPFLTAWLIGVVICFWRRLTYLVRVWIFLLFIYGLSCVVFARGGLAGSGRIWLLLLPTLASLLVGPRAGIIAGVIDVLTYIFFTIGLSQGWFIPQVAEDLNTLSPLVGEGGSFVLGAVMLTMVLWFSSKGWLEALREMSQANEQLQTRTQEREQAYELLQRQTSKLRTVTEITRAGSSILDPEKLLAEVVERIQEGFKAVGVYYVGLFLIEDTDDGEQMAVLKSATGEAGKLLLEMRHKLELNDSNPIGWCIAHRESRIAMNVEAGSVQFDAIPMPHTRSEIDLPLRSRGRVLGALSVQSTRDVSFDEADISALQMMADQVAVAIDNARLFSQTEAALEEAQSARRRYLLHAWRKFLTVKPVERVDYTHSGVDVGEEEFLRAARRAARLHERAIVQDGPAADSSGESSESQTALVVPLKLRDQVIGTLTLHETHRQRPWTSGDISMAETVAEQIALSVENLRLMDETQRGAVRERLVSEVADRMQRAMDMETLARTTAEELKRALGGTRAYVRLGVQTELGKSHEEEA